MPEEFSQPYQQALDIKLADKMDFSTFVIGEDSIELNVIKQAVMSQKNEFFYLFGPPGCGKSHFLSALFQMEKEKGNHVLFIDLSLVRSLGPEVLNSSLPPLVLLDNVEAVAGDEKLELALFGLYNRWYDSGKGTLVISARKSFDSVEFLKRDLTTRLSGGVICKINYLKEDECVRALYQRALCRHINLPKNTVAFLVRHCNRDMSSLVKILDRLEREQIEQSHSLTIPFVKQILGI